MLGLDQNTDTNYRIVFQMLNTGESYKRKLQQGKLQMLIYENLLTVVGRKH